MLTISCYAFHPLAARFVRLWKRVQVVSDWLTWAMGMFCCQFMPISETSSMWDEGFPFIGAGYNTKLLIPQHAGNFPSQPQDEPMETNRIPVWELFRSHSDLTKQIVTSELKDEQHPKKSPTVPVHKQLPIPLASGDTARPALKTVMKTQGAVTTVLHKATREQHHR